MKLPFVSRKKYEILQKNYDVKNRHCKDLRKRIIELQNTTKEEMDKLKKQIDALKPKAESEVLRRCSKCNKYFTVSKVSKRTICNDCKKKRKEEK